MFIVVCMIAGGIILGIIFLEYEDAGEMSLLDVAYGTFIGTLIGIVFTLIMSTILYFNISPVITENVYKLEQHVDTSSYIYYVDVKDSKYAFSYFNENEIIRAEEKNVSFAFEEKGGEVKVIEKRYGGGLDFFFFNFHQPQYNITIPSKEYIRYE